MCEVSRVCRIDEAFCSARPSAALVLSLLRFVNMLLSICLPFPFFRSGFRDEKGAKEWLLGMAVT